MELKLEREESRYGIWVESNGIIHICGEEWIVAQNELGVHLFPKRKTKEVKVK